MINRDPLYNHYLLMRRNCINFLSFRVKSESRPQSFGFEKLKCTSYVSLPLPMLRELKTQSMPITLRKLALDKSINTIHIIKLNLKFSYLN